MDMYIEIELNASKDCLKRWERKRDQIPDDDKSSKLYWDTVISCEKDHIESLERIARMMTEREGLKEPETKQKQAV